MCLRRELKSGAQWAGGSDRQEIIGPRTTSCSCGTATSSNPPRALGWPRWSCRDDLLPDAGLVPTRAITIDPRWRGVAVAGKQMGQGRGVPYSYDFLETPPPTAISTVSTASSPSGNRSWPATRCESTPRCRWIPRSRNRTGRGCWVVAHRTTRPVVRVRYSTTTVGHH